MKLVRYILLFILIVVSTIYIQKYRKEGMADVAATLSSEAIQNIASVYNKDNLTVTNITTTKDITAAGNIKGTNIEATNNIKGKSIESTGNIKGVDVNGSGIISGRAIYTSGGINAPGGWGSHFPYIENGVVKENIIRGNTVIDGDVKLNGKFMLGGADIRDMMIGCSLFDQGDPDNWNSIPFNFPVGKYSLNRGNNWMNDTFDYIRVNPGFKVIYFNNYEGKTDDFSKTITNTTATPFTEVLQPRNALSSLIVEKA